MSVGDEIKQRRLKQRLSLTDLARLAGVSKGYLSAIENNPTARPSATTLFKIASALGTSVAELLGSKRGAHHDGSALEMPNSLRQFVKEARPRLPEADVRMLARIRYRGKAPKTADDWRYIYESIRLRTERR